ncbi:MAG: exodeoxyribonuclease VII small subunit [Proteobacteria bacterium TMED261]|jgi:exodeoxyribonuclease VII small subunit|nr:MAG: exodeoxyribonuclease VII small subunit [Proteobacteria bacterium TMED261]|tara:strand:+ start:753 stop:1010 length:258 start_codon:yes stop_codon:yes gene_type:complete
MAKKNADDSSNESNVDFESALKELENLVSKMEDGELSLDDSLKAFERGIELTRSCQSSLEKAELRIQMLTENDVLKEIDNPSDEH